MNKLLIATDLDRTIVPNGEQPESPSARPIFKKLAGRPEITLLYVSGRNKGLQQKAIAEYDLPLPDYAIGDVGTTLYQTSGNSWHPLSAWKNKIAPDWKNQTWNDVRHIFSNIKSIRLQDDNPAFQNKYKISYYTDMDIDRNAVLQQMYNLAKKHRLKLAFIFSIDEVKSVGLLDVLPKSATKLHALQFIRRKLKIPISNTVFCGDSGNDIPALTSGLPAVMVANTRQDVQWEVLQIAKDKKITKKIYLAQGDFLSMNGNYSAGVLEGISHFHPHTVKWMK